MLSTQASLALGFFVAAAHCQSVWFLPGAQITRFVSTMIVPAFPVINGLSYHALWPGMQPSADDFVYQNVLDDYYPTFSNVRWNMATWYGPSNVAGDYFQYPTSPASVGDLVTTDFQFHKPSGTWTETSIIEKGASGTLAGEAPTATTISVAFKNFPNGAATLTQFLFVIELQAAATWNFGPLTFTGIIMTANTTATSWCTTPNYQGSFTHSITPPVATIVNGQCQCYVAQLTFLAPITSKARRRRETAAAISGSVPGRNFTRGPIKFSGTKHH